MLSHPFRQRPLQPDVFAYAFALDPFVVHDLLPLREKVLVETGRIALGRGRGHRAPHWRANLRQASGVTPRGKRLISRWQGVSFLAVEMSEAIIPSFHHSAPVA